jgi:hypothetical protein
MTMCDHVRAKMLLATHAGFRDGGNVREALAVLLAPQLTPHEVRAPDWQSL